MHTSGMRSVFCYLTLLLAVGCAPLFAQLEAVEQLKKQFPNPERGIWFEHFSGYNQFGEGIIFTLAHDQRDYRGIVQNRTNLKSFLVEGPWKKNQLMAIVADTAGNRVGTLKGTIRDSFFRGDLLISETKKSQSLELRQGSRFTLDLPECPASISYREFYSGDRQWWMSLRFFEEGSATGFLCHFPDSSAAWFTGRCLDPECRKLDVLVHPCNSISRFRTVLVLENDGMAGLKWKSEEDSLGSDLKFALHRTAGFKCRSETHMSLQANSRYVWIENRNYNKWVAQLLKDWSDKIYLHSLNSLDHNESYTLDFVPGWYSDYFISGSILSTDPDTKVLAASPLNYDIRQDEPFSLDDLFEKNSDYRTFIDMTLYDVKTQICNPLRKGLYEFIISDSFSDWCLLPAGICFSSRWHPVHGEYRILIPYHKFGTRIRKNGPLKKLI